MIDNDVIEKHPSTEPVPWVSNTVVTPKIVGSLCYNRCKKHRQGHRISNRAR